MIKLAILTPKNSSEKIKNSLKEITCEIKYIFYNNLYDLEELYLKNAQKYDGIITSGPIGYEIIKNSVELFTPLYHFDISKGDLYKYLFNILKENPVNKVGMFHCCPLNQELVKEALKLGFYISACGPITFKNSKNAEVIANMIPLDRILVETDSPYLSPEPLRGRRNDSRNIKYIVEKIADFKKVEPEVVMNSVFENIKRLFKNVKNI